MYTPSAIKPQCLENLVYDILHNNMVSRNNLWPHRMAHIFLAHENVYSQSLPAACCRCDCLACSQLQLQAFVTKHATVVYMQAAGVAFITVPVQWVYGLRCLGCLGGGRGGV